MARKATLKLKKNTSLKYYPWRYTTSRFINKHTHTDVSNIRLLDSTNSIEKLLETAVKMKYGGIAITDHESVSNHINAIQTVRKMKQNGTMPRNFKLILGNEIYLCDSLEEVKDNYQSGVTKFPHFLLLAKDFEGHEQLRILSSRAWSRSFKTGLMERVPTLYSDLEEIIKNNQGHVLAGSACLGSEINIHLLAIKEANETNNTELLQYHRNKLNKFILWCIDVFGQDNFFIELQPALSWEQIHCNKELKKIAEFYKLKTIITTDAHYPRPEDAAIHEAFLNAKEGEREVASFYEACFLQSVDEIYERMDYLNKEFITECINNTYKIGQRFENYTLEHDTVIPRIELPNFELKHIFKPAYDKYKYIKKLAYSEDEQNRYLIKLIEDGFYDKLHTNTLTSEKFHQILDRINTELSELWVISEVIKQTMSAYYVSVAKLVDIIWSDDADCGGDSLVGSGRGSAAGWIINYIIGITQVNPLEYEIEMPHWRHLHKSRPDVGALDIDLDTEGSKRPRIIQALKNYFGEEHILQVATFGTETSKSSLNTAARGLGYDQDVSHHLGSMIPFERGKHWSIAECLYGDEEEGKKPIKEFINEIEKYPKLKETALGINGLISRRGIHAGGVILFNEVFYKTNSLMKAPNGNLTTAFSLDDCQSVGNIKFDLLTIECLDKIRVTLDMLVEAKRITPQKMLRDTFDKYLHPDVIDKTSDEIYELLGNGSVPDLFQFSTQIGHDSITKVKPTTLVETAAVNSLMRLMSDNHEQPIDTFVKHKNDIQLWYDEMDKYNLNEEEVKLLEKYLLPINGISDTQENIMLITMDKKIAGFSVKDANRLRKIIAKSNDDAVAGMKEYFMESGLSLGNRKEILDYVWNVQVARQLKYSFSVLHTISYTLAAFQELHLNLYYNPIYWQTACLTVNSGSIDLDEEYNTKKQDTNYGKIASAIGQMSSLGVRVTPPDINKAGFSFTPDIENGAILFGLKGLVGIGDDVVHTIIEHRPYSSFEDFYNRLFAPKLVTNSHMLQLIKAGCFDSFNDRIATMQQYLSMSFEPKQKVTTASLNTLINMNLIPEDYSLHVRFYRFRQHIYKKTVGKSPDRKTKNRLFLLDDISTEFLLEYFSEDSIVDYKNSSPIVAEYLFEKEYDKQMLPIKEWLVKDSTLKLLNDALLEEEWNKSASGTISEWEMSSLCYYYTSHELAHLDNNKYNVSNYNQLSEEPIPTREFEWNGRKGYEYEISRIAGTVLDKDKNRHTVTLLTTDGVVTVKLYASNYSFYDRQISTRDSKGKKTVLEGSWFKRGTLLLITGYRRGNQFVPKTYRNSIYDKSIVLINSIDDNGDIQTTSERIQA